MAGVKSQVLEDRLAGWIEIYTGGRPMVIPGKFKLYIIKTVTFGLAPAIVACAP